MPEECDEGVPSNESYAMLEQLTGAVQAGGRAAGFCERPPERGGNAGMTVVMLEGQGHGDFLSCAASQRVIIDHTIRLYRQLTSAPECPPSGARFVRWQRPRGSTAAPSPPRKTSASAAGQQGVAPVARADEAEAPPKAAGAGAAGGAAAASKAARSASTSFAALSACTRWWRSLRWHTKSEALERSLHPART